MSKTLFEITITGYKVFYVEAPDQEAALSHDVVMDEASWSGDFNWEHDSTEARELSGEEAQHVNHKLIVKEE